MDLKGKRALVTGGSRGIGAATCRLLAARGASVAVNYVAHRAEADAVAADCLRLGVAAVTIQADVAPVASARALVAEAARQLGGLDILINNAGLGGDCGWPSIDEAEWDRVMGTTLKGSFFCTQAAVPWLRESGSGRVVMVSSLAGKRGTGHPHYAAAKAGVMGLAMSLAHALAPDGITVNSVYPGLIATDFGAGREAIRAAGAQPGAVPLGRAGEPEDVAHAIVFLLESDYMTGAHLNLTGGRYMGL